MAKYTIAWMPGDGVGNEVMEAARLVLDAMHFDAEYVPADIGDAAQLVDDHDGLAGLGMLLGKRDGRQEIRNAPGGE